MHIDGIKEVAHVDGYEINLIKALKEKKSKIYSYNESKKL